MFATANWCLAVVQGTVRSWLPLGLSSPAIRPMANAGACPKFLRWGHARPLIESSLAFCALWLETSLQRGCGSGVGGFPKATGRLAARI